MAVIEGGGAAGSQEPAEGSLPAGQAPGTPVTPMGERVDRVHWFAGRIHEVLDDLTGTGVCTFGLGAVEAAEAVVELLRAADRLQGLALAVLAHADRVDVAAEAVPVATSTGAWLASAATVAPSQGRRLVRLARALDVKHSTTGQALLAGTLDVAQAQVVVEAVAALPGTVSAAERDRAERHLLAEATGHHAGELRLLGRHLLAVIDPDAAEEQLRLRLEREEANAARETMLVLRTDEQGRCHGRFRIPALHGAMLQAALDALASPRRPDPIGREAPDETGALVQRSAPQVWGEAFTELLERFPVRKLPRTGGGLATVLVTIPVAVLETGLGVATLSTGGKVTAGAARRLACHHGLIPVVLGAKSEPLDVGRKSRLHTEPQRTAIALRDQHCTAETCTVPAARCHVHHNTPWSRGGHTTVHAARLLCPRHHRIIHTTGYHHEHLPNGQVRITKTRRRRQ